MLKNFSRTTITINIIALLAIFYDIFVIFEESNGLYGVAYLFTIYFISILYLISFIHLFYYKTFKDKSILAALDLFPIFLFGVIVAITQETDISIIAKDIAFVTLIFYILGGILILLSNYVVHKVYFKLKGKGKASKNKIKY